MNLQSCRHIGCDLNGGNGWCLDGLVSDECHSAAKQVDVRPNTAQQAQPAICRNALVRWVVCRCSIDKRECDGKGQWTEDAPLGMEYSHQCERYGKQHPFAGTLYGILAEPDREAAMKCTVDAKWKCNNVKMSKCAKCIAPSLCMCQRARVKKLLAAKLKDSASTDAQQAKARHAE